MNRVFIINKPINFTSQDVVSKFKKIMQIKKAGHTGTLDPLATGVLPILTNNCTKLSKYLIEHNKEYIATIKLGIKTSTGDNEGEIIEKCDSYLRVFPNNYEVLKVKADALYDNNKTSEAMELYDIIHENTVNGFDLYDLENRFNYKKRFEREEKDPLEIMMNVNL